MSDTLKNWLPITKWNRVAVGFIFMGLVMLVTWNFIPVYEVYDSHPQGLALEVIWGEVFSLDFYLDAFKSPSIDDFISICACMALIQNAVVLLVGLPFWKIFHASNYLKVPLALVNLVGGLIVLKFFFESFMDNETFSTQVILLLIAMSMLAVFLAMLIFKNELELRHDLEVKKTMGGD